jgi:arabinofuranosyltransferase
VLVTFQRSPSALARPDADEALWAEAGPDSGTATVNEPDQRAALGANPARWLGWLSVSVFVLVVLRRGWMCDDAFITMRAVDNLVHGRGFAYNADARVLGFTNPLWALLVAIPYGAVGDPYLTPVVTGVLVSAAFAWALVFRVARDPRVGGLVLGALCFSRSFVDFSTSGLENSLTHLLTLLVLLSVFEAPPRAADPSRSVLKVLLFASLAAVNRADSLALVAPPVLWFLWRERAALRAKPVILGLAPALAWFAFAGVYYGFLLPNTAYAKLNAKIPHLEMVQQGLAYLDETLDNDAGSAILLMLSVLVLFSIARRGSESSGRAVARAVGVGSVASLLYVIWVGGDFMAGRFLTPAIAAAAVVLARHGDEWLGDAARLRLGAAFAGFVALALPFSPFHPDVRSKREFPAHRIVDERNWYSDELMLSENLHPKQWHKNGLFIDGRTARDRGERVVVINDAGMFAWGAGPTVHVVDDMALTDPLLARVPFEYREDWRAGHFPRKVPQGYVLSLILGKSHMGDPCLGAYFEKLQKVVTGPLFTVDRWKAIFELNLPGGATVLPCPERGGSRK